MKTQRGSIGLFLNGFSFDRMKSKAVLLVACSAFSTLALSGCTSKATREGGAASAATAGNTSSGTSYKLPPFEEKKLANGLQLLFIPDNSLPYVSLSMIVRTGSIHDPDGLEGLSSMVAELIDKGTKRRSAPQIAAELGQIGAEFDATASTEYTTVSGSSLSMKADALLKNFVEIVTEPTFSEAEVERMRKQVLSAIQRLEDQPEAFSSEVFRSYLFGDHVYAHPKLGTLKSVAQIKKKHIIQYYLRHYRPNNSILAVVGKLTPEFKEKVEQALGAWQKRDVLPIKIGQATAPKGRQILLVDKPGLVQAQIRMGSIGIARKSPDFLVVRLANTILGAPSLASRLNDRIRRDLGLTYSIHSMFDARQEPGPFALDTFTKNESVAQTINETLKVVNGFREKGVSPAEVEEARGYLKGIFPQAIETPEKLAVNLLLLRFYDVPDTYLTNYISDLDKISANDVNRAIKKYFDDENIKILVYTSADQITEQMKTVKGELTVKKASEYQ